MAKDAFVDEKPGYLRGYELLPGDQVVVAWPELCSGPGWSNTIVWVIIQGSRGGLRREALQPEEQTDEMRMMFEVCGAAAKHYTGVVSRHLIRRRSERDHPEKDV